MVGLYCGVGAMERQVSPRSPKNEKRNPFSQLKSDVAVFSRNQNMPVWFQSKAADLAGGSTGANIKSGIAGSKAEENLLLKQAAEFRKKRESREKKKAADKLVLEMEENMGLALNQLPTQRMEPIKEEINATRNLFCNSLKDAIKYFIESIVALDPDARENSFNLRNQVCTKFESYITRYQKIEPSFNVEDVFAVLQKEEESRK